MSYLEYTEPRERDGLDYPPPALDPIERAALDVTRAVVEAGVMSAGATARFARRALVQADRSGWIEPCPGGWQVTSAGRRAILIHVDRIEVAA